MAKVGEGYLGRRKKEPGKTKKMFCWCSSHIGTNINQKWLRDVFIKVVCFRICNIESPLFPMKSSVKVNIAHCSLALWNELIFLRELKDAEFF